MFGWNFVEGFCHPKIVDFNVCQYQWWCHGGLGALDMKNDMKLVLLVVYTLGLKITSKFPSSFGLFRDGSAGQYHCFLLSIDDLCLQVQRADIVVVACGQTELVKVTIYFKNAFQLDIRMCKFIV